jgi:hypothetical protein
VTEVCIELSVQMFSLFFFLTSAREVYEKHSLGISETDTVHFCKMLIRYEIKHFVVVKVAVHSDGVFLNGETFSLAITFCTHRITVIVCSCIVCVVWIKLPIHQTAIKFLFLFCKCTYLEALNCPTCLILFVPCIVIVIYYIYQRKQIQYVKYCKLFVHISSPKCFGERLPSSGSL